MDGSDGDGFRRGRQERIDIRIGVERRRKWSREDRLRIVQELLAKGALIVDVAKRNEISQSLIYEWREQALAGLLDDFHQVRVVPDTNAALPAIEAHRSAVVDAKFDPASPEPARGRIELTLPARGAFTTLGAKHGEFAGASCATPSISRRVTNCLSS